MSALSRTTIGEATDEIAYEGDDFQVALITSVSIPILSSFDCEMIELRIRDHNSLVTIHDRADASRVALAMPYRDPRLHEFLGKVAEAA